MARPSSLLKVLTIAGSDPGGGAGIQQDGRVFTVLGAHGCGVVTALTVQNTLGVGAVAPVSPSLVRGQIEAVISDIRPVAAKTGMLARAEIVEAVAGALEAAPESPLLVVDPVMVSKNGRRLLSEDATAVMAARLFPLATAITPNIPEAEALLGRSIRTPEEMRGVAEEMRERFGCSYVVLTGGHLEGHDPVDVVASDDGVAEFSGERIETEHTHGTGCAFSAALTVFLARGFGIGDAAAGAREFVSRAISGSRPMGQGIGPVNSLCVLEHELARYPILRSLDEAWRLLSARPSRPLVPEVQLNLGYALPYARTVNEVAAFPGRIVGLGEGVARVACPEFGASSHVARIILTAMRYDADCRAAVNIRYDAEFLQRAEALGFSSAEFSRLNEPEESKVREGSTLVWGVKDAIERSGAVPDIIQDAGDVGKEPIIRVLGRDPVEVVEKALKLAAL